MYRRWFAVLLFLVLVGCTSPLRTGFNQELEAETITGIAWNERVELNVSTSTAASVVMQIWKNGSPISQPVTVIPKKRDNFVIFDLPKPPAFPFTGLPETTEEFENRGTVVVSVRKADGTELKRESYTPFGAVVNRQINVLLPSQSVCPATGQLFSGFKIISSFSTNADVASGLCFLTLDIDVISQPRGTSETMTYLANQVNELAISRNVFFDGDGHSPTFTTTPTCGQVANWYNNLPYLRIDEAQILEAVNAEAAHTSNPPIKGDGVTVAVIGSGVDVNAASLRYPAQVLTGRNFVNPLQPTNTADDFWCDFNHDGNPNLVNHDTMVASIINSIAPEADIVPLKSCNSNGECKSSDVILAFLYLMKNFSGTLIVNTSLSGSLPDHVLTWVIQHDDDYPNESFFIVASNGNTKVETPRYPATYSPLSVPQGHNPLANFDNVISVAALGLTATGYERPQFNTRKNNDIYAPGANMCPYGVTILCQTSTGPGTYGTSFAAPVASGVAALYAQKNPGANLYTVLTSTTEPVPGATNGRVYYR